MASPAAPTTDQNKAARDQMEKAIESFKRELGTLRTGRASLSLLDNIRVDYYGNLMPLNQVATLSIPEPRTITIQAWDKNAVPLIEKAITQSPLGLMPNVDGQVIRINMPALTQERRQELVKVARHKAEECRVAIRNARRDAKDAMEKKKKDGKMPEDDLRRFLADLQKVTDDEIHRADDLLKGKEKEILET